MRRIFVTGLCSLHWGRLQYGNIGNYYIIEPLFRQLHRVFPQAEIVTTFQMTEDFVQRENITVLPLQLYYAWEDGDLENARREYETVLRDRLIIPQESMTPYMCSVLESDVIINVSGDMWGDNAEHVGRRRFWVDLYKMRTAQLLGKSTVLFAGTPGPFSDNAAREFAKETYANFSLVINREPTSTQNMQEWGFCSTHVKDFACPAFLYEPQLAPEDTERLTMLLRNLKSEQNIPLVGFTIGGFNMPVGPYDMWPREDSQYDVFATAIEELVNTLGTKVVLISHTNGFELPPHFKLINGRDYPILKQLEQVVRRRGKLKDPKRLVCLGENGPYLPDMTKSIIGQFDLMVTGRVHASVAAISQYVPTVFITYEKSFIPSTKMYGFSSLAGVGEFVCEPGDQAAMLQKIHMCFDERASVKQRLQKRIPEVKMLAEQAFDEIAAVVGSLC